MHSIQLVMSKRLSVLLAVVVVSVALGARVLSETERKKPSGLTTVQRTLMGTIWSIRVADHGRPDAARLAAADAYRELARIEELMSEWKPESPISKVDAAAGRDWVEVPEELRTLLERSVQYSEESKGTFDVTWRGMGNIWHFDNGFVPPLRQAVETARKRINYRAIQFDHNRVYLPAGMSIGLGGIAKGYAIDRAMRVLQGAGFVDSLVDGGGDVLVSGSRYGEPWRLGIQHPRQERGILLAAVAMKGGALITSGDYERFRIVDGVRYHHIIDPRTGWPAKECSSVTVITPTAERGVVLSKAIFILGPEQGLALARREKVETLVIDVEGRRFLTEGMSHLLEKP